MVPAAVPDVGMYRTVINGKYVQGNGGEEGEVIDYRRRKKQRKKPRKKKKGGRSWLQLKV